MPLIDRGVLQGVLVVQTIAPRTFSEVENCDVGLRRRAGLSRGQRSTHARPVHRAIAGKAVGAGAQSVVELGSGIDRSVPRSGPRRVARAEPQSDFPAERDSALAALERRAGELVLHGRINYAYRRQREYLDGDQTWGATHAGVLRPRPVAYFSAEFGLHESMPDLLRRLGCVWPAITSRARRTWTFRWSGIGLFYGQGYFRQHLDMDGWQQEEYLPTDVESASDGAGDRHQRRAGHGSDRDARALRLSPRCGASRWAAAICCLLDSNVEGNSPEDRELTSRLYGGDGRVRIRQELLLGVGGFRALKAMGITPGVLHLNEGHSAFAVLEAIRQPDAGRRRVLRSSITARGARRPVSRRTRRCPPVTTASARA